MEKKQSRIGNKFGKIKYLIKKSIYFAWYRHHFLIPPRVLVKYIRSFFVVLKRGGSSANLFINQKEYLKWFENNSLEVENRKNFK